MKYRAICRWRIGLLRSWLKLLEQRLIQCQLAMANEAAVARALKGHGFGVSADLASLCLKPLELLLGIGTGLEEAREVVAPQCGKHGAWYLGCIKGNLLELPQEIRIALGQGLIQAAVQLKGAYGVLAGWDRFGNGWAARCCYQQDRAGQKGLWDLHGDEVQGWAQPWG